MTAPTVETVADAAVAVAWGFGRWAQHRIETDIDRLNEWRRRG